MERCDDCGEISFHPGTCYACGKNLCYECSQWVELWEGATNTRYCKDCYRAFCDNKKVSHDDEQYSDYMLRVQ